MRASAPSAYEQGGGTQEGVSSGEMAFELDLDKWASVLPTPPPSPQAFYGLSYSTF